MSHRLDYIVLDTNVLISAAILPKSASAQALLYAVQNFQVIHSDETWSEFCEVINRKKFDRYLVDDKRNEFILAISRASEFIKTVISISDCPDPKDNKFLELAVEASAKLIVSGDAHLLNMNPYRNIKIINSSDFLAESKKDKF